MRRRPLVFACVSLAVALALAAPSAEAGKLDTVTQTVKSLVDKKENGGGLLGNGKLNILKKLKKG